MRLHSAGRARSVAGKPTDFPTHPGHLFWHCAHLGCCDLSTGFWRSHTGNVWFIHLVHITVVKSASLWGKECLGLLFQELATVILMVSLYSSVIWTCLQLFPEGMCSTWQLMKISFKVTSYLLLPVWIHISFWNPLLIITQCLYLFRQCDSKIPHKSLNWTFFPLEGTLGFHSLLT